MLARENGQSRWMSALRRDRPGEALGVLRVFLTVMWFAVAPCMGHKRKNRGQLALTHLKG